MIKGERRIHELDGIRGIAAFGVVLHHYHSHLGGSPLPLLLGPLYRGGFYFVDLFFVLSGFILAQVYAYEARYPTLKAATVSRIARLYPLHLFTLVLVAVLQKIHVSVAHYPFVYPYDDRFHFMLNLILLNDSGLQKGWSFNGPAWSISTEFIINFVFLSLALRSANRSKFTGFIFVVAAIALDLALGWTNNEPTLRPFNGILRCFLGFGIGLLARTIHEHLKNRHINTWLVDASLVATCACCVCLIANPDFRLTFYLLTTFCFPAVILLCLHSHGIGSALGSRPLVYFGQLSFSLYLVHFPLELAIRNIATLTKISIPFSNPVVLFLYCILCVAASHATWKYLEVPARRWVRQFA